MLHKHTSTGQETGNTHTKTRSQQQQHITTRVGDAAGPLSLRHPSGYRIRMLQILMQLAPRMKVIAAGMPSDVIHLLAQLI
jgi:hypothetical protein